MERKTVAEEEGEAAQFNLHLILLEAEAGDWSRLRPERSLGEFQVVEGEEAVHRLLGVNEVEEGQRGSVESADKRDTREIIVPIIEIKQSRREL